MVNAISTLVGEELNDRLNERQVDRKEGKCYVGTIASNNGSLYGILVKFNPFDESITHIGPDFGGNIKWFKGAMADNGIIYCPPYYSSRGILKIDTNTDTVTLLNANLLPEQGNDLWESCAAALDGCIYFMPYNAHRIMKLDPSNGDAMSSVGNRLCRMIVRFCKYSGTVVGIDGCVYGIPHKVSPIVKYDPMNDVTSFMIGTEADKYLNCSGDGVLGRDGCIYAVDGDGDEKVLETVYIFLDEEYGTTPRAARFHIPPQR